MALDVFTLIIGVFAGGFFATILAAGIFVWNLLDQLKYRYQIDIENNNSGKPVQESYRAQKILHEKLGEVYYVPKLKREGRPYIPCNSTVNEYPMVGNPYRKFSAKFAYRDGTYVPIKSEPKYKEKHSLIEQVVDEVTKKLVWRRVEKEVEVNVTVPLKTSNRQFTLFYDSVIKEEYKKVSDFWSKYGPYIMAFGIIFAAVAVAVFILVFTTEAAKNLPAAPGLADAVASRTLQLMQNTSGVPLAP